MYQELKGHVLKLLKGSKRLDGRKLDAFRDVSVEYGISKTAEGSARVKIGNTEVIAGVKVEIGKPYPDAPDKGSIMVGVELLPLSNPEFELGPPSIKAIELARVVDRGIRESNALDFKQLCIEEGEKVWLLLIDICPINDEGNLQDAASLAALAALQDMHFPAVDENGKIDYKNKTDKKLAFAAEPVAVTVFRIGEHFIVDPITDEERLYDARLTVAILADDTLCAMQKGGDSYLTLEDVDTMVGLAITKAKDLRKALKG
jgi:exosome complex component RRP42